MDSLEVHKSSSINVALLYWVKNDNYTLKSPRIEQFYFIILDTQRIWFIGSSLVYCASKIAFSKPEVDVLVYRMQVVIFLSTAKGELNGGILIGLSKIIYTNSPLRTENNWFYFWILGILQNISWNKYCTRTNKSFNPSCIMMKLGGANLCKLFSTTRLKSPH
jgi:hypothetical protein